MTSGTSSDELDVMYQQLRAAAAELEQEQAKRREAELALEELRQRRVAESSVVMQDLERKRQELNALREERLLIKEWLDRGVSECRRVAEEASLVKRELEARDRNVHDLLAEKDAMNTKMQQLSAELQQIQASLETLHAESAAVRVNVDDANARTTQVTEQNRAVSHEYESVAGQLERLVSRVRGLPEAEIAMDQCCAALESVVVEMNSLDLCIRNGGDFERFDEVAAGAQKLVSDKKARAAQASDKNASPNVPTVATSQGKLPVTTAAKGLVRLAQETLNYFRPNLKSFISVKQKQLIEQRRQHMAELQSASAEKDRMLAQHAAEVDGMKQRVTELEKEIIRIAEGQARDLDGEATARLSQLDKLSTVSMQMQDEIARLRDENVQLRATAKRVKVDWNKVEESRRRFHQLKVEVQLLREHSAKIEAENRNLRLFSEGMLAGHQQQLPPGMSADGVFDAAVGRNRARVHRSSFEEWKASVVSADDGDAAY
jgi:chromosome segregation ATPase